MTPDGVSYLSYACSTQSRGGLALVTECRGAIVDIILALGSWCGELSLLQFLTFGTNHLGDLVDRKI